MSEETPNLNNELMKQLMKRNNTISLAILIAMISFLGMMFTFMQTNSNDHNAINTTLQKEIHYSHDIYKWVILPNDSLVKMLINNVNLHQKYSNRKVRSLDSIDANHDYRITTLENLTGI